MLATGSGPPHPAAGGRDRSPWVVPGAGGLRGAHRNLKVRSYPLPTRLPCGPVPAAHVDTKPAARTLTSFDAAFNAFHHDVIHHGIVFPYCDLLDTFSWWISQLYMIYLCQVSSAPGWVVGGPLGPRGRSLTPMGVVWAGGRLCLPTHPHAQCSKQEGAGTRLGPEHLQLVSMGPAFNTNKRERLCV